MLRSKIYQNTTICHFWLYEILITFMPQARGYNFYVSKGRPDVHKLSANQPSPWRTSSARLAGRVWGYFPLESTSLNACFLVSPNLSSFSHILILLCSLTISSLVSFWADEAFSVWTELPKLAEFIVYCLLRLGRFSTISATEPVLLIGVGPCSRNV